MLDLAASDFSSTLLPPPRRLCFHPCLSVCHSFCLSFCLSVCSQDISKSYERISLKLSGMIGHVPRTYLLDFGKVPDVFVDPGSRISPESMDLFV
jgi:hypothetical protein